jgi:hypothetical protein
LSSSNSKLSNFRKSLNLKRDLIVTSTCSATANNKSRVFATPTTTTATTAAILSRHLNSTSARGNPATTNTNSWHVSAHDDIDFHNYSPSQSSHHQFHHEEHKSAHSQRMLSNGSSATSHSTTIPVNPNNFTNSNNNNNNNNGKSNSHHTFMNGGIFSGSSTMLPSVKTRLIKNFGRTKEKILEGIGKTDRTADTNFDVYVEQFERQHAQASKLNKELNKYMHSLKEIQKSSKSFYDTLKETYEPEWPMCAEFQHQVDIMEAKWAEYLNTVHKEVQLPLVSYLNEFPELKKKIEKRHNRLLDFDSARHTLESVQHKTNKKMILMQQQQQQQQQTLASASHTATSTGSSSNSSSNSSSTNNNNTKSATDQLTKLTKVKIDLEDKQHIYEEINQTLCLSLPVLFENRVKFYSSLFQTFFHTETNFHSECVEVNTQI